MLKISPPVQKFSGLNAHTTLFAFPGNEEIPSSSVHMCLEKETGERNGCGHVCICVGSHTTTVDDSKNDTFLLLLAGSKSEGTCKRTEKNPHAVKEMRCWREQGAASRRQLGWHYGFSTAAAWGNVCPRRGSAYMWGGGDSSLRGGKAGKALGMWIPQKQIC